MTPPTWISPHRCELCGAVRHAIGDWLPRWERWAVMWFLHEEPDRYEDWGDDA